MSDIWLSRAKEQLQRYTKLKEQTTNALHIQFFNSIIPRLTAWIDEFEATGKISSDAYEMVMGNE